MMAKSDLAGDYDAIELRNSEKNKKGSFFCFVSFD
jgi:hypothetical protein